MATTDTAPTPAPAPERSRRLSDGGRPPGAFSDRIFRWLALTAGLLVLAILALIAISTTGKALPWFRDQGLFHAVFSDDWDPAKGHFGAGGLLYGTLLVGAIAMILAIPISIGIALFVTEVCPKRMRRPIVYTIDLLAAIPSVVFGLWALNSLSQPTLADAYQSISDATSGIPIIKDLTASPAANGLSYMTAGLIVAIMVTPIVTSLVREVFATCPPAQKEAALALGATRWEMIRGAVFPHSRSGIVAASMIGLGRALGETIAVALVIGASPSLSEHLFGPGQTMAGIIPSEFGEASGTHRSALIGLGVVLFVVTIAVGILARGVLARSDRRKGLGVIPATVHRRSILEPSRGVKGRKARNLLATGLIGLCVLIAMVPLVLVIIFVINKGGGVFGIDFLTSDIPIVDSQPGGGMGPAVVGTLVITGTATLMAVPLGILGGIYLNEYGGNGVLARVIRFMAEVMTGVPSVVMGLFIYTVFVLKFKELNGFVGALALAALMLPIVIRTTDEILRLVPNELREGSFALGSRKVRTIRTVVLPHAMPGIVSGSLLAVARAAGETAPLLFTIGITSTANWNPFNGSNTTLSAQIYKNAASPFPSALERGYGAALTLVLLVFLFTALARIVTTIYARRAQAI